MAVSTRRTEKWGRWVGPVSDIAAIAELASQQVNERRDSEKPADCRISVALPGLDHEFGGPDDFARELRAPDLTQVEDVSINVGSIWASEPVAVSITWRSTFGVTLIVTGSDRAVVAGTAQTLGDRIKERASKRGVEPLAVGVVGWLVAAGLTFAVGLAHIRTGDEPADPPYALALLAGWAVVGGLSYWFTRWCFPRVELLAEGQPSRWIRARTRVLGTLVFLAAIAGGVLADRLV